MQRHRMASLACLGFALMFISNTALAQYQLTNLSSNQVKQARHDDPLLVNGWGLVHAPGSPWWVSDNNSGWSTLYDAAGNRIKTIINGSTNNYTTNNRNVTFPGNSDFFEKVFSMEVESTNKIVFKASIGNLRAGMMMMMLMVMRMMSIVMMEMGMMLITVM